MTQEGNVTLAPVEMLPYVGKPNDTDNTMTAEPVQLAESVLLLLREGQKDAARIISEKLTAALNREADTGNAARCRRYRARQKQRVEVQA